MTFKTSSKRVAEIDAASKNEEHLLSGITHPGLHDCLCGRGGHATNHPGNVQFRILVSKYKSTYMGLSRYGKLQVAGEVVKLWRSQTPAGRFLAMTDPSQRENTTWHDVGDKEAIKKTSQCLRERIPPHQKARTLEMVSKKAKATRAQASKLAATTSNEVQTAEQEASPRSPPVSTESSTTTPSSSNANWETLRHQMKTTTDWQPRPLLEAANVPVASSSNDSSPHTNSAQANQISMSGMPQLVQNSIIPMPLPTPINESNSLQRQTSVGSIKSNNEELTWMDEILNEELRYSTITSATHAKNDEKETQVGAEEVDGSLIPSAANLTRDVFDVDEETPDDNFTRWVKKHSFGMSGVHESQQTLNQTLSLANIFPVS